MASAVEIGERQFSTFGLPRRLFLQIYSHPFPAHLPQHLSLQEAFTQHPTESVKPSQALIAVPRFAARAQVSKYTTVYTFFLMMVDLLSRGKQAPCGQELQPWGSLLHQQTSEQPPTHARSSVYIWECKNECSGDGSHRGQKPMRKGRGWWAARAGGWRGIPRKKG